MSHNEDTSFFERERDKLSGEVTAVRVYHLSNLAPSDPVRLQGFEELLSSSNVLNRKLEEVLGMTREYETIAALWNSFHELMQGQRAGDVSEDKGPGLPGTGGHTVSSKP
jgi:DASH complex subunit DAD1